MPPPEPSIDSLASMIDEIEASIPGFLDAIKEEYCDIVATMPTKRNKAIRRLHDRLSRVISYMQ
jgi:hypothetical protein